MVAGLSAWGALLLAVLAWFSYPLGSVIPLLILVTTFEAIRTLHFGAERIGRYLQVFYEEPSGKPLAETPSWERTAMVFGPAVPGAAGNPLFSPIFGIATAINFIAVILPGPVYVEVVYLAIPHMAFLVWILKINRDMRTQRATELERYRLLLRQGDAQQ
jgi:hypothetical protein